MKTKVVIRSKQIADRVQELGAEITASYNDDKPVVCVCVLRGAVLFFSQLIQHIRKDVTIDFITLSSYKGTSSTGEITLLSNLREDVEGKHVLIVEDIVDSGRTVKFLREYMENKNALDVKVACLLDKPMSRKMEVNVDYKAFELKNNAFVIGYGLDYNQLYRNLPDILEVEEL